MVLLSLAAQSLRNRKLATGLTIASIALSVGLLLGVERVRTGARDSFANTISQTDLIVGARGGAIQLLLYVVFHMGSATNNISYASYETIRQHPAVKWTIPLSLGDNHRGFRVVGTTTTFYEEYRYRRDRRLLFTAGHPPQQVFDVVLGHAVAQTLAYQLGQPIVLTHGLASSGFLKHGDTPFRVVGILEPTSTPIDRALYVSLEGIAAIHTDWQDGTPPRPGQTTPAEDLTKENLAIDQITAFLLRSTARIDALRLQREINTFPDEPLMAILPGVTLNELWRGIGYAEDALRVVTIFVVIVGLLGMLIALYTSLSERRREMAILRALGAGPLRIVSLLVLESGLFSLIGCGLGVALTYTLFFLLRPIVEGNFGLSLPITQPTLLEWGYLGLVLSGGILVGGIPAWKAYRNTLADGLGVRL